MSPFLKLSFQLFAFIACVYLAPACEEEVTGFFDGEQGYSLSKHFFEFQSACKKIIPVFSSFVFVTFY